MKLLRRSRPEGEGSKALRRERVHKKLGDLKSDSSELDRTQFFDLYKLMVGSSEALVSRRHQVNTFFLTINGLLLTALGFFLRASEGSRLVAGGVAVLGIAGGVLALAWRSLLISFGQLNTGKFEVINRMEQSLPASIFTAEWEALDHGKNPAVYRTFTSREVWVPNACVILYTAVVLGSVAVAAGWWRIS